MVGEIRPLQEDVSKSTEKCIMDSGPSSSFLPDSSLLEDLKRMMVSGHVDQKRFAAKELRKLAKVSSVNRFCIAEIGGVPLLINALSTGDTETQTHAVTALFNLTLRNENNKLLIVSKGLDMIIEVMHKGKCLEARENATALLFNVTHCIGFRTAIGSIRTDVFGTVVAMLRDGSTRGRKDATATLYNLLQEACHGRALAVRAGAVDVLLDIVKDRNLGLVNESLSVLLKLVSHQEGQFAIMQAGGIKMLIDLICDGTDSNKDYACAMLLVLCKHNYSCAQTACMHGARELLTDLSLHGTEQLRRRALKVLEYLDC